MGLASFPSKISDIWANFTTKKGPLFLCSDVWSTEQSITRAQLENEQNLRENTKILDFTREISLSNGRAFKAQMESTLNRVIVFKRFIEWIIYCLTLLIAIYNNMINEQLI